MMDIDRLKTDLAYWDEVAPEDALAAYVHEYGVQFLKLSGVDGDICYFAPNGNWVPFLGRRDGFDRWRRSIPRPTKPAAPEWDGEGYAEPGQKVSYNNGQYFEESEVLARKDCWLWLDVPSVGLVTVQQVLGLVSPIRTKEQRERDELSKLLQSKDAEITELVKPIDRFHDFADAIIAAGYRKQERD